MIQNISGLQQVQTGYLSVIYRNSGNLEDEAIRLLLIYPRFTAVSGWNARLPARFCRSSLGEDTQSPHSSTGPRSSLDKYLASCLLVYIFPKIKVHNPLHAK